MKKVAYILFSVLAIMALVQEIGNVAKIGFCSKAVYAAGDRDSPGP